jgi:hypothetical protein
MSHDADTTAFIDKCVGPRRPGTIWFSGYDQVRVEVLAVDRNPAGWMLWSITEADIEGSQRGRKRTHCTPWGYDRDRVVSQPEAVR